MSPVAAFSRRNLAGGDQFIRKQRRSVGRRLNHELCLPCLFGTAFRPHHREPGAARIVLSGDLVDLLDKTLLDRVDDRCPMMAPAHRISVFGDVAFHFAERSVRAAVHAQRGEHFKLSAPGGARERHVDDAAGILVQIGLVDEDVSALAGERLRRAGKRDDAAAGRFIRRDKGADPALGVDDLKIVTEKSPADGVRCVCPLRDVIRDEFMRGEFVARGHPLREVPAPQTFVVDAETGCIGDADPARFRVQFHRRVIDDPVALVR